MILNQNRVASTHKIREPMFFILTLETMLWILHLFTKKSLENETLFGNQFYTLG